MAEGIPTSNRLPPATNAYDKTEWRKEDQRFYQSKAWKKLRERVLNEQPICVDCQHDPATEVHHVIERKLCPSRELDRSNLVGLCRTCHNKRRKNNGDE